MMEMVCSHCGSDDVKRDAWAEWDKENQQWTLSGDPFDAAICESETCEGNETRIAELIEEGGKWYYEIYERVGPFDTREEAIASLIGE